MIGFLHSRCLLKQGYRFCEEIIEVQGVVCIKFVLIRLRYISDVCKLRCIRDWCAILIPEFSGAESPFGVTDDIPQHPRRVFVRVKLQFAHYFGEEFVLNLLVKNSEVVAHSDCVGVLP